MFNVLLLDTTNLNMADQMYLSYELSKFLNTLKPKKYLAIYMRNGAMTVPLQAFTNDPTQLSTAIHKALPRFMPTGREYQSDVQTLDQMVGYLEQLPGRKNILWFSGFTSPYGM